MSFWKNNIVNLGVIQAGLPKKVIFEGVSNMPNIEKIHPYCGCTTTSFDKENKVLTITYSNKPIPVQVKGPQSVTKSIDIKYNTGETETLYIKAIRVRYENK